MLNSELTFATWKRGFVVVVDSSPGLLSAMWSSSSQKKPEKPGQCVPLASSGKGTEDKKIPFVGI